MGVWGTVKFPRHPQLLSAKFVAAAEAIGCVRDFNLNDPVRIAGIDFFNEIAESVVANDWAVF